MLHIERSSVTGRFLVKSKSTNHNYFEAGGIQADWLAGLIAADGCIHKNKRQWSLSQSGDSGLKLVSQVAKIIDYEGKIYRTSTSGNPAHSITVTSPKMINDLKEIYSVGPQKTLTLEWPKLEGERAAAYLRGYVDGDGCVGVYNVGRSPTMLSISLVATEDFVLGAENVIPPGYRLNRIARCKNLFDLRWNGRKAYYAGNWIYVHEDGLPMTKKSERFLGYGSEISGREPRWYIKEVLS